MLFLTKKREEKKFILSNESHVKNNLKSKKSRNSTNKYDTYQDVFRPY